MCAVFFSGWNKFKFKFFESRTDLQPLLLHLKEADKVGEDEEGGGAVDPLQEAEEDEGAPVDDEPRGEDRLHTPYRKVLAHQRSWRF